MADKRLTHPRELDHEGGGGGESKIQKNRQYSPQVFKLLKYFNAQWWEVD